MIGMTCSRQQHPSTSSLCQTLPTPDWYLESKPRRLLGKKKNLVPAKRKRSKLSYLNGRRVSLDDSGRQELFLTEGLGDSAGRTGATEGVEEESNALLYLFVRIEDRPALGVVDQAHGQRT